MSLDCITDLDSVLRNGFRVEERNIRNHRDNRRDQLLHLTSIVLGVSPMRATARLRNGFFHMPWPPPKPAGQRKRFQRSAIPRASPKETSRREPKARVAP